MKKIAYIVNTKSFFCSHRLPLAVNALNNGYNVSLFTGSTTGIPSELVAEQALISLKIPYSSLSFTPAGLNPFVELYGFFRLVFHLSRFKPNIVHCISPKGILYGGIASRLAAVKAVVFAISGMGYAFTTTSEFSLKRSFIKCVYNLFIRLSYKHSNLRVIVQNHDDQKLIIESKYARKDQVVLIQGSGVRLSDFESCSPLEKDKIVLLPARMNRDKGVFEFVEAVKSIRTFETGWRFLLAGAGDYKNPSAISPEQLEEWQREGDIEWLGHVDDMPGLLARAAIVCLPSYREGMPKALLEAAAAGCAVVTTDVTGCREAIVDGETGDLVAVQDSVALSKTLLALMRDDERRARYGINGQKRALERFSIDAVVDQTFEIYRELLNDA